MNPRTSEHIAAALDLCGQDHGEEAERLRQDWLAVHEGERQREMELGEQGNA